MDEWQYKPARDHGLSMADRWRSNKRESGLIGRIGCHLWSAGIWRYLRTVHHLQVSGREHLPTRPPFMLVANHTSHLDALILAAILPRHLRSCVFPIAAGDTFFETHRHALFAAGLMNALPMWRKNCGRHAMQELRARLVDDPCGLILFPEGTRSRTNELAPFKPGVGMIVAGAPVPVIPCHIKGAFDAWPPQSSRPRWGKPLSVSIAPALEFSATPNGRAGWEEIASSLESAVRNQA